MPLDKPQSALIFNNYIGENDAGSNMNASLNIDNDPFFDINLFFILSDFYYDFSKETLQQEADQLKTKFNKIEIKNIVKPSSYGDIEIPAVFDKKTGQIITPFKKVFKHFPEFTNINNSAIYELYNQDFFSIISDLKDFNIDNFDDRVNASIDEAQSLKTLKNIILFHKIFSGNEITNSNQDLKKVINIDQNTLAILDYMFTNKNSEVTIPYVKDKLPKPPPNVP